MSKNIVPVALGEALETDEDIINYANEVGYSVIIKPLNGSMAVGVYTNISDKKNTGKYFEGSQIKIFLSSVFSGKAL